MSYNFSKICGVVEQCPFTNETNHKFIFLLIPNPANITLDNAIQGGRWQMSASKFASEPCLWLTCGRGSTFGLIKSPSGEYPFVPSVGAFASPTLTPESETFPLPFPYSVSSTDHLLHMQVQVGGRYLTPCKNEEPLHFFQTRSYN